MVATLTIVFCIAAWLIMMAMLSKMPPLSDRSTSHLTGYHFKDMKHSFSRMSKEDQKRFKPVLKKIQKDLKHTQRVSQAIEDMILATKLFNMRIDEDKSMNTYLKNEIEIVKNTQEIMKRVSGE